MYIEKNINYQPEDVMPYKLVREHLRYDAGDAEDTMKAYVTAAYDYLMDLTGIVMHSLDYTYDVEDPSLGLALLYPDIPVMAGETPETISTVYALGENNGIQGVSTAEIYFNSNDLRQVWQIRELYRDSVALNTPGTYLPGVVESAAYIPDLYIKTPDGLWTHFNDFEEPIPYTPGGMFDMTSWGFWMDLSSEFIATIEDNAMETKGPIFKIKYQVGESATSVKRQFKQAALLLIGHYDAQREAEYFGGISTEVKEGVNRILRTLIRR